MSRSRADEARSLRHHAYSRLSEADSLILFLHGIQGSPLQFEYLTSALPAHIDYLCPLLPGHGGDVRDFRSAGWQEWTQYTRELCSGLSRQYRRVYFVGHSLGCLLGIDAATSGAIDFAGMLLIACPLRIRPSLRYISTCYRAIREEQPASPYVRAAREANSVAMRHPFEALTCAKPYLGLLRMMLRSRRRIGRLTARLCMIHSGEDEIVSKKSLRAADRLVNGRALIVADSGHFYYPPFAQESIRQEMKALLERPNTEE